MKTFELSDKKTVPFKKYTLSNKRYLTIGAIDAADCNTTTKFFGNPTDVVFHQGYFEYLATAWENHYSVVMRPDDIWYVILCELTSKIAKEPAKYESLFTTTPGSKQEISVPTCDIESIDPQLVIEELKDRVPSNVDTFIPEFSTTTLPIKLAMNVAFCDLVSPYYNYSTYLCGIPNIRIEGTLEDWHLILKNLEELKTIFKGNLKEYLNRCLVNVQYMLDAIDNNDAEYFRKMVKLNPCGSGHQFTMNGWILQFLCRDDTTKSIQLEGLPNNFSKMNYTNLDTGRKFTLYCGLFYSRVENEFLVPGYDAVRIEKTKKQPTNVDKEDAVKLAIDSMRLISEPITTPSRKLNVIWTPESEQDIKNI